MLLEWLRRPSWPPYVVGALLGALSWFAFLTVDQPLGVSTAFVQTAGLAERAVAPEHVAENAYFTKTKVKVGWEWMLVAGIFLGAWASSRLSRERVGEKVPALWSRRFGKSVGLRYALAFAGGFLIMLGARLAGGCTSGHGISGCLQLAASGWLFFGVLFVAGLVAAHLIYGKEAGSV